MTHDGRRDIRDLGRVLRLGGSVAVLAANPKTGVAPYRYGDIPAYEKIIGHYPAGTRERDTAWAARFKRR